MDVNFSSLFDTRGCGSTKLQNHVQFAKCTICATGQLIKKLHEERRVLGAHFNRTWPDKVPFWRLVVSAGSLQEDTMGLDFRLARGKTSSTA
jgi:hypothetical protein